MLFVNETGKLIMLVGQTIYYIDKINSAIFNTLK